MIKDKNDSDDDARELVRLLKAYNLPAKVNLIPFNPWPGAGYECSTPERIRAFSEIVFEGGISAPVRTPRGRVLTPHAFRHMGFTVPRREPGSQLGLPDV
jgi:23S rRNA (adenine2503-C2)-methyltransferase